MTRYRYTSQGFRPVTAEGSQEAACLLAARYARQEFGRGGHVRTLLEDCRTRDGTCVTYVAFIGRPVRGDRNTTTGRNWTFTVHTDWQEV